MKTCRKDFQGRKNTTVLKLLCRNIAAGRFNWRRYCTPQTYFGLRYTIALFLWPNRLHRAFPLLQHAGSGI